MITTVRELRKLFWKENPQKITDYSGNGLMYPTDTRCAWVDWLDMMSKANRISQELANRATL